MITCISSEVEWCGEELRDDTMDGVCAVPGTVLRAWFSLMIFCKLHYVFTNHILDMET